MCVFRQMLVAQSLCKLCENLWRLFKYTHTHSHLPVIKACIVLILHLHVSVQTHPLEELQRLPLLTDLPTVFSLSFLAVKQSHIHKVTLTNPLPHP